MNIPASVKEKTREMLNKGFERGIVAWDPPFLAKALANHGYGNKNPYHGGNAVITQLYSALSGYSSKIWLTFARYVELKKENNDLKMKAGSKSVSILRPVVVKKRDKNGEYVVDPVTLNVETFISFSPVNVFNSDCFTGYEFKEPEQNYEKNTAIVNSCEEAERLILSYYKNPPKVKHDVIGEAYYCPSEDTVHLSVYSDYKSVNNFISTLVHELAHSTGSASRQNRKFEKEKEDSDSFSKYSFEELVAEITASMYCIWMGYTDSIYNSAAYIAGWKSRLDENTDWFFRAFSYAEKAFEVLTELYVEEPHADTAEEKVAI